MDIQIAALYNMLRIGMTEKTDRLILDSMDVFTMIHNLNDLETPVWFRDIVVESHEYNDIDRIICNAAAFHTMS